ncbi:hypothetical protein G6F23_013642 [Rhizopus arrhizus]|nr:hypothetical protein G6F23_013642 [Rhizopus arrhizus]
MQIATAHAQVRACLHRRARRHTLELEHLGAARAELHRHRGTGLQLHAAFDRRAVDAAIAVAVHDGEAGIDIGLLRVAAGGVADQRCGTQGDDE